ncbi:murein DD-endopeptidase MepM/ murein hydrolase activator NlpD [Inquilinus ginsengisoli]|uniref:Murein DD-endopeptidase MepM/ murein hydrolase activator NlpD n=1 Tax=Inquilinus ginsengisoli TaxID=363840 RepID=A0ABU1JHA4_9PROT|nr:M23 family metallopeptidase [Inquilinus ginsengisoli]MDR6287697.1 murein DD-endopeptidase MepM/ murein hydrolase activator NlpD [Inquilinus ginsengisoli]
MRRALFGLLLLAAPAAAQAQDEPRFSWPVACTVGKDCFVQNYVDADPGPGRADFHCGPLTYDGHDGTDIRLPDLATMQRGVAVVAAADGTVLRVRDGEPDVSVDDRGKAAIEGREAGNGVIIDHGNGWQTLYGHMKRGSLKVHAGDVVKAGQPLGQVGLSGDTEFPHLHFGILKGEQRIDPFTDEPTGAGCNVTRHSLWTADVPYIATGTLIAGFATGPADANSARLGRYSDITGSRLAPLVFWAESFGVQAGDVQIITIAGPDGALAYQDQKALPASKIIWFAFSGKRPPATQGWKPGTYTGRYRLERNGAVVAEAERTLVVP